MQIIDNQQKQQAKYQRTVVDPAKRLVTLLTELDKEVTNMSRKYDVSDPAVEVMLHGLSDPNADEPRIGDETVYRSKDQAMKEFKFVDLDRELAQPGGTSAINKETGAKLRVIHLSAIRGREVAVIKRLPFIFIIE